MRGIGPGLAVKIHRGIPRVVRGRRRIVGPLLLETLQTAQASSNVPSTVKCSSETKSSALATSSTQEDQRRHVCGQQPVPILAEDRRIPDRVIHVQADKPPEQQVVLQLLHQHPRAVNRASALVPHETGRRRTRLCRSLVS